jgi:Caspase domain/Domain of unknown function (DUF4384)
MSRPESTWPRRVAAVVFCLSTCLPVAAQTFNVLQPAPLRADRSPEAAPLTQLAKGQGVGLLQMSGGWVQVQVGSAKGWLRASQLDLAGAEVAAVSRLETGRRASGASAVTLGIRALPPRNNRHALIIGVGTYRADPARPVTPLAGVTHDIASAMTIARMLQVPADNMTVLRDAAATRDGVQQALRDLDSRMRPGDRVFFYWSGHGSRYFDPAEEGCVETLVPHDLRDIGNQDFAAWFRPLATKADKMLVIYDACHSGGVDGTSSIATRSLATGYVPKFTPAATQCQQPSNLRTRSLEKATGALGLSGQDIVHISSARPDEVSFDNAQSGGLATSSMFECLHGDARDVDGSGAVSIDEIAVCAQTKIETKLKPFRQLDPHHLVVSGNRAFVPAWFTGQPAPQATAPAPTPGQPAPPTVEALVQSPGQPVQPTPARPGVQLQAGVQSVLDQIHAQRDSKRRVAVTLASKALRIGIDSLDFSVTSSHDGHVYVAMLGSDQQSLYLLFPNDLDARNRIVAGESMLLPRSAWRMLAAGPKGKDSLLVMVADGPRDLSALAGGKAGPFTKPLTDAAGRIRLQWLLGQGASGGPVTCAGSTCSDAFGSALLQLEEY